MRRIQNPTVENFASKYKKRRLEHYQSIWMAKRFSTPATVITTAGPYASFHQESLQDVTKNKRRLYIVEIDPKTHELQKNELGDKKSRNTVLVNADVFVWAPEKIFAGHFNSILTDLDLCCVTETFNKKCFPGLVNIISAAASKGVREVGISITTCQRRHGNKAENAKLVSKCEELFAYMKYAQVDKDVTKYGAAGNPAMITHAWFLRLEK